MSLKRRWPHEAGWKEMLSALPKGATMTMKKGTHLHSPPTKDEAEKNSWGYIQFAVKNKVHTLYSFKLFNIARMDNKFCSKCHNTYNLQIFKTTWLESIFTSYY